MRTVNSCPWCEAELSGADFPVIEKMHGTGEVFQYSECPSCRSMTLTFVPFDLDPYYPDDYYSFTTAPLPERSRLTLCARRLRTRLSMSPMVPRRWAAQLGGIPGWLVALRPLRSDARLLDVGGGGGRLVARLRRMGFDDCRGVDPYVDATNEFVDKNSIHETHGSFDLVMFHHSLEHVAHPVADLLKASELVGADGRILVRLPVAAMEAWEIYGADWVALDPPRHLSVPSVAGMYAVAARCGLEVESWWCDATGNGWWASELARRGVPHSSPLADEVMPAARRKHYAAVAAEANRRRVGDTAAFVLRRSSSPTRVGSKRRQGDADVAPGRRRRTRRQRVGSESGKVLVGPRAGR